MCGNGDGVLNRPDSVAVSAGNGHVLVTDYGNHRVCVFDESGAFVKAFGSYGKRLGEFRVPTGIAIRDDGHVFVSDVNDRVSVFDKTYTFVTTFGSSGRGDGQLSKPRGLAFNSDGHVYVADCGNHRVCVFDEGGTFVKSFGSEGSGDGQFNHPHDVAITGF